MKAIQGLGQEYLRNCPHFRGSGKGTNKPALIHLLFEISNPVIPFFELRLAHDVCPGSIELLHDTTHAASQMTVRSPRPIAPLRPTNTNTNATTITAAAAAAIIIHQLDGDGDNCRDETDPTDPGPWM